MNCQMNPDEIVAEDLLSALESLYGKSSSTVLDSVKTIAKRIGHRPRKRNFDSPMLLAYPGNISGPGCSPLAHLAAFIEREVSEAFRQVHVLPFMPSTSDHGFSPLSYDDVDPALGTWSDIEAISRRCNVMADIILHHTSSTHPWLKRFLAGDASFEDFYIRVEDDDAYRLISSGRMKTAATVFQTPSGPVRLLTRYGPDQVDLNLKNPKVFLKVIEVAARLISHGVSAIRLDALAYSWKETGTSCAHLPGTATLLSAIRLSIRLMDPHVLVVPEIDFEVYGPHYLRPIKDTKVAAYDYGFMPVLLHAALSGRIERLASHLVKIVSVKDEAYPIRFLSTHDGIFLRPYAPVLSSEETLEMRAKTVAAGGLVSERADGATYELNIPVVALLRGEDGSDDRLLAALFILLSVPGIPLIYLNTLLGVPPQPVLEGGDRREINRCTITADDAYALASQFAGTLRHALALIGLRNREATLFSHAEFSVDVAERGFLVLRRSFQQRRLTAIVNLGSRPVSLGFSVSGASIIHCEDRTYDVLLPYEFDWLLEVAT